MIPEMIALLEGRPQLVSLATGGIWDRPIKRLEPGTLPEDDPAATPEAFDASGPIPLLKPSVVVSPWVPRQDHGGSLPRGWGVDWMVTVACYAPPGGSARLRAMGVEIGRALENKRVPVPQGGTGRIRNAHLPVGPEVAPEFPVSGEVVLETFVVSSIWRVP